jgi:hypothetical protein
MSTPSYRQRFLQHEIGGQGMVLFDRIEETDGDVRTSGIHQPDGDRA